jgi:large subunit ribosomal protein L21
MTKAVVRIGGKQYIVAEKDTVQVDRLPDGTNELTLDALLIFGDKSAEVRVGAPFVSGVKVTAKVTESEVKGDKIRIIRYKSKKRVHKEIGHRQKYSVVSITSIK